MAGNLGRPFTVAYSLVSVLPVCSFVLDLMNYPETAVKVNAAGVAVLCSGCVAMFGFFGRSLIRAMNQSILQQHQRQQQDKSATEGILRARKKVCVVVALAFGVCGAYSGLCDGDAVAVSCCPSTCRHDCMTHTDRNDRGSPRPTKELTERQCNGRHAVVYCCNHTRLRTIEYLAYHSRTPRTTKNLASNRHE